MTFIIVSTIGLASVLIIVKSAGGRLKGNRLVRDMDLSVSGLIKALGVTTLAAYAVAIGVMATSLVDNVSAMDETAYEQSVAAERIQEAAQAAAPSASEEDAGLEGSEIPEAAETDSVAKESAAGESLTAPAKTAVTPAVAQSAVKSTAAEQAPAAQETAPAAVSAAEFADGTYSGSGYGFRGNIAVDVTVQGGSITNVSVTDQQEDRKWFQRAYSGVVQRVLSAQSENVDTVSGATYSSRGIIDGVAEALSKARAAAKQVTQ